MSHGPWLPLKSQGGFFGASFHRTLDRKFIEIFKILTSNCCRWSSAAELQRTHLSKSFHLQFRFKSRIGSLDFLLHLTTKKEQRNCLPYKMPIATLYGRSLSDTKGTQSVRERIYNRVYYIQNIQYITYRMYQYRVCLFEMVFHFSAIRITLVLQ